MLTSCKSIETEDEIINGREVLVLATCNNSQILNESITRFNNQNSDYFIKLKSYAIETEDALYDSKTKLMMDIINNHEIDIVMLQSLDTQVLIYNNLLLDLYTHMNSDNGISRDIYYEKVLNAFENNGKLFRFPISFYVETMIGKKSIWNGKTDTSFEDIKEMINNSNAKFYVTNISQETALSIYFEILMEEFIDFDNGKCYFTDDKFLELLMFINEYNNNIMNENSVSSFKNDKGLLYYVSLMNFSDYELYRQILSPDIFFIGIPFTQPNYNIATATISIGVSSKTKHLQGALEYIKYISSDDFLNSSFITGFPITKSALNKKIQKTQSDDFNMGGGLFVDDEMYNYSLSSIGDDDIDVIMEQINMVNKSMKYNNVILTIVIEESESFFIGQKSAEEVAEIIQNRVSVYLSELS